jgi:L-alanine-DL-glutamate epimerase-like enolase superfamily enzyme
MPLKRPYGTARGVTTGSVNFIARLWVSSSAGSFEGIGESQPRHRLTGDGLTSKNREAAWSFFNEACQMLPGRRVALSDEEAAISDVRAIMAEVAELAKTRGTKLGFEKPFRGSMLGIEIALLDAASRAMGLKLSELLGERRQEIRVSISTISTSSNLDKLDKILKRQAKYPMIRVKGTGEIDRDIDVLCSVAAINAAAGREKPIWIDTNEGLSPEAAETFIDRLVEKMATAEIPSPFTIEQPVKKEFGDRLPSLQKYADAACLAARPAGGLEVRIMADESIWDAEDAHWLEEKGGIRALNFKIAKAGGLLATLDAAEAALAGNPDIKLSIGGMIGTSDLTAFALHNLGRAFPTLDYITATPPGNVAERIATPQAAYAGKDTTVIIPQEGPGLGCELRVDMLASFSTRRFSYRLKKVLTFGGDTSLGDVHHMRKGGETWDILSKNPMYFFDKLRKLTDDSDHLIINFESVLAENPKSPLEGKKRFLGWDNPERSIACLKELGVTAVALSNNHAMDFGADVMHQTIIQLEEAGIVPFGAGISSDEASRPLTIPLDFDGVNRNVHIFGVKARERKLVEFGFFATKDTGGVAQLDSDTLIAQIRAARRDDPESLLIVSPHWNFDYKWPTDRHRSLATAFIDAGANFVIGHGTHIMSDFILGENSGVIWSLGNFQFNWGGRHHTMPDAVPYSLVARLNLSIKEDRWDCDLRVYPTRCDNIDIGYQPRPVSEEEMYEIIDVIAQKSHTYSIDKLKSIASMDEFGWNFSIENINN